IPTKISGGNHDGSLRTEPSRPAGPPRGAGALGAEYSSDSAGVGNQCHYPNPGNVPAAAITEINNVVALLESSFINNATVNITVDFTANCGLGCSNTLGFLNMPYSSWRGAMINDAASNPQNTFLNSAVLTLPAADPIGNGTMSFVRRANAEAI